MIISNWKPHPILVYIRRLNQVNVCHAHSKPGDFSSDQLLLLIFISYFWYYSAWPLTAAHRDNAWSIILWRVYLNRWWWWSCLRLALHITRPAHTDIISAWYLSLIKYGMILEFQLSIPPPPPPPAPHTLVNNSVFVMSDMANNSTRTSLTQSLAFNGSDLTPFVIKSRARIPKSSMKLLWLDYIRDFFVSTLRHYFVHKNAITGDSYFQWYTVFLQLLTTAWLSCWTSLSLTGWYCMIGLLGPIHKGCLYKDSSSKYSAAYRSLIVKYITINIIARGSE